MTISRATMKERNITLVAAALERTLLLGLLVRVIKDARLYAFCHKDPLQSYYRRKDVPFLLKFVELKNFTSFSICRQVSSLPFAFP